MENFNELNELEGERDFFAEEPKVGPSRHGRLVGNIGGWVLHAALITFALYSGYHGISATAAYRADGGFGRMAGIIGIVTIEAVLLAVYLMFHNNRITGAPQQVAAGSTFAIGFVLAMLGIVADSQLNAGYTLTGWLEAYLYWGLPIAPAVMAFGAMLIHELAPERLRAMKQANQLDELDELKFTALMASRRADMDAAKIIKNAQLTAKTTEAERRANRLRSDYAMAAIEATAAKRTPATLKAAGIDLDGDGVPDVYEVGRSSDVDLEDLVSYLVEERLKERDSAASANGTGPVRPTSPRTKGQ